MANLEQDSSATGTKRHRIASDDMDSSPISYKFGLNSSQLSHSWPLNLTERGFDDNADELRNQSIGDEMHVRYKKLRHSADSDSNPHDLYISGYNVEGSIAEKPRGTIELATDSSGHNDLSYTRAEQISKKTRRANNVLVNMAESSESIIAGSLSKRVCPVERIAAPNQSIEENERNANGEIAGPPSQQLVQFLQESYSTAQEKLQRTQHDLSIQQNNLQRSLEENKVLKKGIMIADTRLKDLTQQLKHTQDNSANAMAQAKASVAGFHAEVQYLQQENQQLREYVTNAVQHIAGLELTIQALRETIDRSNGSFGGYSGFQQPPPDIC